MECNWNGNGMENIWPKKIAMEWKYNGKKYDKSSGKKIDGMEWKWNGNGTSGNGMEWKWNGDGNNMEDWYRIECWFIFQANGHVAEIFGENCSLDWIGK